MLAHAQVIVRAPDGDRLGSVAAEAARVGIAPLGAQDIDEHAVAALIMKALDRGSEDAVVVQGFTLSRPLASASGQFHCERLSIRGSEPLRGRRPRASLAEARSGGSGTMRFP